ncbi:MAG: type II toxin-antitoxin system tRNA(fMet)-specific endonuclease VapC [Metallibacterium sp.]
MAARYLLDTHICIYIQRQRPPAVLERFRRLKSGEAVISVITWGELAYGAEKSRQRDKVLALLEELVTMLPVMPLPGTAGQSYGAIRAALEAKGEPIGNNDLWIAAHAKAAGLIVVTNNEREFKRVPGLQVRNWAMKRRTA